MKFGTIAGLLSCASAIDLTTPENEEALEQQDYEMSQLCQNMDTIDSEDLIDLDEESAPKKKYVKKVRGAYKKHYGLSKAKIDAENHHILSTQATCMKFVKQYRGHPKVCNWCKAAKAPSVIWKWDTDDKVWFRWYENKWHYWGPSKHGFTAKGWTWYKGYWHHNGWIFKHTGGMWWRFQAHKWVKYSRTITINPTPPRGPKICRPFFMLKKWGFPTSLGAKTLPRCKVGAGKAAIWYMWKDRGNCRFLGGRLVYQKIKTCKSGRPHQWAKVTRCVRGPILSKKGLNYKTGKSSKGKKVSKHAGHKHVKKVVKHTKKVVKNKHAGHKHVKKNTCVSGVYQDKRSVKIA